jgi:hypothetical protein
MSDERIDDGPKADESWREVGRQFQALGQSLANTFRTAWESEQNRQHLEGMKAGLESLVGEVDQAIREASASPEAQKARQEVEKAVESARVAGEKALQDARPQLLSALRQLNVEIQKFISSLEQEDPASEDLPD